MGQSLSLKKTAYALEANTKAFVSNKMINQHSHDFLNIMLKVFGYEKNFHVIRKLAMC